MDDEQVQYVQRIIMEKRRKNMSNIGKTEKKTQELELINTFGLVHPNWFSRTLPVLNFIVLKQKKFRAGDCNPENC